MVSVHRRLLSSAILPTLVVVLRHQTFLAATTNLQQAICSSATSRWHHRVTVNTFAAV